MYAVMCEEGVEENTEHTSLQCTSAEGNGFGEMFANMHSLWSITKKVQDWFG